MADVDGGAPRGRRAVRVPVASLLPAESPRLAGEDERHVRLLAESESELPPILVHRQSMRVIDGMHRLRVAMLREQETVEVEFFDGSADDAFVLAVRANRTHGLPLSLEDREAAAARIIEAQPERSDRSIAVIAGLSARTVGEIRRRMGEDHAQARIGRDGRVRPINGAVGRQMASELIARRPDAPLREIARAAGISPATARDVRERLRRGDDPLPPRHRAEQQHASGGRGKHQDGSRAGRRSAAGLDRASILQNLSEDPSLRFTESGRRLLRWLFAHATGPNGWEDLMDAVPPHCGYVMVEIARCCAEEWSAFADRVQQQLVTSV